MVELSWIQTAVIVIVALISGWIPVFLMWYLTKKPLIKLTDGVMNEARQIHDEVLAELPKAESAILKVNNDVLDVGTTLKKDLNVIGDHIYNRMHGMIAKRMGESNKEAMEKMRESFEKYLDRKMEEFRHNPPQQPQQDQGLMGIANLLGINPFGPPPPR